MVLARWLLKYPTEAGARWDRMGPPLFLVGGQRSLKSLAPRQRGFAVFTLPLQCFVTVDHWIMRQGTQGARAINGHGVARLSLDRPLGEDCYASLVPGSRRDSVSRPPGLVPPAQVRRRHADVLWALGLWRQLMTLFTSCLWRVPTVLSWWVLHLQQPSTPIGPP